MWPDNTMEYELSVTGKKALTCYSPKDPEETEKLATKDHLI